MIFGVGGQALWGTSGGKSQTYTTGSACGADSRCRSRPIHPTYPRMAWDLHRFCPRLTPRNAIVCRKASKCICAKSGRRKKSAASRAGFVADGLATPFFESQDLSALKGLQFLKRGHGKARGKTHLGAIDALVFMEKDRSSRYAPSGLFLSALTKASF